MVSGGSGADGGPSQGARAEAGRGDITRGGGARDVCNAGARSHPGRGGGAAESAGPAATQRPADVSRA